LKKKELTGKVAHAILPQEIPMLREIQEPDRETVSESEIPTEPRLRAISSTIYTISSTDVLLQRLEEAARIQDCCVSLLVHNKHGWHELFLDQRGTKSHSMTASYVRDIVVNNDLDLWMERISICADGDDEHEVGEIDAYQLVVYNQG
jgi:hypothetical protein